MKKPDPYKGLPNKDLLKQLPAPVKAQELIDHLRAGKLVLTIDNNTKETLFYQTTDEQQIRGILYTIQILNMAGCMNVRLADITTPAT